MFGRSGARLTTQVRFGEGRQCAFLFRFLRNAFGFNFRLPRALEVFGGAAKIANGATELATEFGQPTRAEDHQRDESDENNFGRAD